MRWRAAFKAESFRRTRREIAKVSTECHLGIRPECSSRSSPSRQPRRFLPARQARARNLLPPQDRMLRLRLLRQRTTTTMSDGTPAALEVPLRAMSDSDSSLLNELHDALGQIIADERRQWQRDLALIEAQAGTVIAELRAQNLELRTAFEAKLSEFSDNGTERLALVRDGK